MQEPYPEQTENINNIATSLDKTIVKLIIAVVVSGVILYSLVKYFL